MDLHPAHHPLPAGAAYHPMPPARAPLPDAVLDLLTEWHADTVAAVRLWDAKPASDALAPHYRRWTDDAQRRARRIRTALRDAGCGALADRLAMAAAGIVAREGV